jgi:hypothetical protein
MINKENVRKWVDALRSGEYEQGKMCLCNKYNKYCCLGVACEIVYKNGVILSIEKLEYGKYYNGNHVEWPDIVKKWFGFYKTTPIRFEYNGRSYGFIGLNDTAEATFEEIADLIEKEYLND